MFKLGIPKRHYRRATMVLGPESADHIEYEVIKQDDGFYIFSFPESDEKAFRDIAGLLNRAGVLTVGDDEILTERKIMKLADLVREQEINIKDRISSNNKELDEATGSNLIEGLKKMLIRWNDRQYKGGVEGCEKSNHYNDDLMDLIEDITEDTNIQEQLGPRMKSPRPTGPSDPGTSSPMVSGNSNIEKIKPEGGDIQSEVTIKQQACAGNLEKCLEDVEISWDGEGPFKLTFEYDDTVDDAQAYDESDVAEYVAKSDDEYYQFILDVFIVSPKFSGDGGAIEDFNWETLRIEVDPRMDPEIRSDFDDPIMERLKKLAGIIKN